MSSFSQDAGQGTGSIIAAILQRTKEPLQSDPSHSDIEVAKNMAANAYVGNTKNSVLYTNCPSLNILFIQLA